jgi:hypothetical protein
MVTRTYTVINIFVFLAQVLALLADKYIVSKENRAMKKLIVIEVKKNKGFGRTIIIDTVTRGYGKVTVK